MAEDKALTLKRLFNAIDPDRITKEDFVSAFEAVVNAINDEKTKLSNLAEQLNQAMQDARKNLDETSTLTRADLTTAVATAISKIQNGKDGKDGRDGVDGLNADEERVINEVLGRIKLPEYRAPIMDGPEELAIKLDLLDDERQLAAIKKLKADIEELKKRPARGGGTSAMGVASTFKYIAHTEAPSGDIDGVNTTYTVKNSIFWIAGFTLNGEQIAELPNFTYAGKTITFTSALPAAYSGKDFEVKYIGI